MPLVLLIGPVVLSSMPLVIQLLKIIFSGNEKDTAVGERTALTACT